MQNSILKKSKRKFNQVRRKYGITTKHFTESDFYRICEGENIEVITKKIIEECNANGFRESKIKGAYARCDGITMIYLLSIIKGKFDLFVAYHELGHHFFKHLGNRLYEKDTKVIEVKELEADQFAELATGISREEALND